MWGVGYGMRFKNMQGDEDSLDLVTPSLQKTRRVFLIERKWRPNEEMPCLDIISCIPCTQCKKSTRTGGKGVRLSVRMFQFQSAKWILG
jgi:hypothetical protein